MKQQLLGQLNAAAEYFDRSTGSLTEEDSAYAPAEGVFTTAQQVAHAANTIDWFVEGAFRPDGFDMNFEEHERKVREVTSLVDARAWVARSVNNARTAIESKSDEEWAQPLPAGLIMGGQPRLVIFGGISDHTAHHRGALTVYARLLGKTPPMPYMDPPA
jgi:uncharacterized damage-inducible protein DinB